MRFTVYHRDDANSKLVSRWIIDQLNGCQSWHLDPDSPELVICIGGDGTILRAIHQYMNILQDVYFVAVHTGTLGFFTDYIQEELGDFIEDLKGNCYREETSQLLEIQTDCDENPFYALNEIRMGSFTKTLDFDIYIDGELFEHSKGSGLCISTQAGSTAVSRALQGAVIDDGLEVLQLCEIMPVFNKKHRTLSNPYIMRSDRKITLKSDSFSECEACYDHLVLDLKKARALHIRLSERKVRFARFRPYSYLKRLRNLY